MAYLIGTDEAGYGPNLGPLLVSASVWRVPDELSDDELARALGGFDPVSGNDGSEQRLTIADSKRLFRPKQGLAALEQGVLACLATLGKQVSTWRDVWSCLAADSCESLFAEHYARSFDAPLPRDADARVIDRFAGRFQQDCQAADVQLLDLRSAAVVPIRWNELLDEYGSKGTALAMLTLNLVRQLLPVPQSEPVRVQCDKLGGRNRYSHLLQSNVSDYVVEIVRESRALSVYRWGPAEQRVEWRFATKGERFLPTALASMASKYLRELAMLAFNQFWTSQIPGLKPTAGYPVDAQRFRAEIRGRQQQLGIEDNAIWRQK
jgi:hypothetical protein